jgi:hypothetical protein
MPIVLNGTTGITTPTYNGSTTAEYLVPVTGFKNRIINGDMTIDQRNAGAAITQGTGNTFPVDRFFITGSVASKFTAQQSSTAPAGFNKSLLITSSSAYSVGSGDFFVVAQNIEGFNVADLKWGTAQAKTVCLSFQVYSSLTGTFGGALVGGSTYSYPFTYTISSANTWTTISVTVAGSTSGGTWDITNGSGLIVRFGLGVGTTYSGTAGSWSANNYFSATGATSVVGTNGATFYITGVQLEVGSNATSFDYLPYGTELALCQRYYYKIKGSGTGFTVLGWGWNVSTTESRAIIPFKVPMRTRPTALEQTGTASDYSINYSSTSTDCSAVPAYRNGTSLESASVSFTVSSGLTDGQGSAGTSANSNTNAFLAWSAEL